MHHAKGLTSSLQEWQVRTQNQETVPNVISSWWWLIPEIFTHSKSNLAPNDSARSSARSSWQLYKWHSLAFWSIEIQDNCICLILSSIKIRCVLRVSLYILYKNYIANHGFRAIKPFPESGHQAPHLIALHHHCFPFLPTTHLNRWNAARCAPVFDYDIHRECIIKMIE